ncbi:MAG: hypothetical protein ACKO1U_08640 [Bacteroidota bacterium]
MKRKIIILLLVFASGSLYGQRLERLVVNNQGLSESKMGDAGIAGKTLEMNLEEDLGATAYVHAYLSPDSSEDAVHNVTFVCLREYQGKLEWYDERTADIRSHTTHCSVSFTLIDEGLFQIVMRDAENPGRIYGHSWFKVTR